MTFREILEIDGIFGILREYFNETSRQSMLERRSLEADFSQTELNKTPMTILNIQIIAFCRYQSNE